MDLTLPRIYTYEVGIEPGYGGMFYRKVCHFLLEFKISAFLWIPLINTSAQRLRLF